MSDAFGSDLEILVPKRCEPFAYHMNCCNSYVVSKAARAARSVNVGLNVITGT